DSPDRGLSGGRVEDQQATLQAEFRRLIPRRCRQTPLVKATLPTGTNSLSRSTTGFLPRISCHHWTADPSTIKSTSRRNEPAITASNRQTAAWRINSAVLSAPTPLAFSIKDSAPLMKPSFGSAEKIFR